MPTELLFVIATHGRQKGLRQYHGVLDQIRGIKHQATTTRLAMQDGQAMRQAQHPGGGSAQTICQVVAMVEIAVGDIRAATTLGPGEIAVAHRIDGKLEQ